MVTLAQGANYGGCPSPRPLSLVCDLGATGADSIEGDLTARVEACSTATVHYYFADVGLRGCGLSTAVGGTFYIVFSVANSLGLYANVSRTIRVLSSCANGVPCRDFEPLNDGLHDLKP